MTAGWRSPLGGPRSDREPETEPVDWDDVRDRDRGPEATLDEAEAIAGRDTDGDR